MAHLRHHTEFCVKTRRKEIGKESRTVLKKLGVRIGAPYVAMHDRWKSIKGGSMKSQKRSSTEEVVDMELHLTLFHETFDEETDDHRSEKHKNNSLEQVDDEYSPLYP